MTFILLYILLCIVVGLAGRNQPVGFVGYSLLAFFFSPMIGLAVLLVMLLYTRAATKKGEA